MPHATPPIKGKIHGRTIELDRDTGFRDGTDVTVRIEQAENSERAFGEGLRKSAGSWADDADELDEFIQDVYRSRQDERGGAAE